MYRTDDRHPLRRQLTLIGSWTFSAIGKLENDPGQADTPGIIKRRKASLARRTLQSAARLSTRKQQIDTAAISTPIVTKLEHTIMQREAVQFLRRTRSTMTRSLLLAFFVSTGVAIAGSSLAFSELTPIDLTLAGFSVGALATLVCYLHLRRRFAQPSAIWKQMLDHPVHTPAPLNQA